MILTNHHVSLSDESPANGYDRVFEPPVLIACGKGPYHTLMQPKRHQAVEHAILTFVLRGSDHLGYSNTLPGLAQIIRQTPPDIDNREIVDTLKRLRPQYLTLWKFSEANGRFLAPQDLGNKHCRIPCKTVIHDIGKC